MISSLPLSQEVCHCKKITVGEIFDIFETHDVQKLGQLQDLLMVGTECRNCLFEEADTSKMKKEVYCKDLLDYYKEHHG